jgi:exopolysaccharide biosynthesis predicted pyruvyltransferase EpsI
VIHADQKWFSIFETKPQNIMINRLLKELKHPLRLTQKVVKKCLVIKRLDCFLRKRAIDLDMQNFSPTDKNPRHIVHELSKLGSFTFLPNPGNMGDCVIAQAEYQVFAELKLNYTVFRGDVTDNLVYGGGGIFVSNWKDSYQRVLEIFRNPKIKRIIILPSSFSECSDLLEIIDERFTIFCREKQSYEYLLSAKAGATLYLENDMVFYLKEKFAKGFNKCHSKYAEIYRSILEVLPRGISRNEYKIAYFLRGDSEGAMKADERLPLTFDLSRCIASYDCRKSDVVNFYSKLFFATIDTADIIVTDRLHVGICSALMGKKVFLLDNSYHKVLRVYENSMKNMESVYFVDNANLLAEALGKAVAPGMTKRTANMENIDKIGGALL